ncbi:carbon-nitrogen hydrolase family protein [Desulfosoma sp.]
MLQTLRLGLLHLEVNHGDLEANRHRLIFHAEKAAQAGARLIVAPELAVSGYSFESRAHVSRYTEVITGETFEGLSSVARRYGVYLCAGIAEKDSQTNIFYNSALMIGPDGRLVGHHRKVVPAERRWACPGEESQNNVVKTPWGCVGILICADTYYGLLPRVMGLRGVDLLIVPANWPPSGLDPRRVWRARALENGFGVVGCNRTGMDRLMDCRAARSYVVAPDGEVLLDASSETSAIYLVDYPLRNGKLPSFSGKVFLKRPPREDFMEIYLDVNSAHDLTQFWSLPPPNVLPIWCLVPESSTHAAAMVHEVVHKSDAVSTLVVFPQGEIWIEESQWRALVRERPVAVIAQWKKAGQGKTVYGCLSASFQIELSPDVGAVTADFGPARLALVNSEAFSHPEISVALSKQGCDIFVCAHPQFDADARLLYGVKCLERAVVVMVTPMGAMICEPPMGHEAWKENLLEGFGMCSTVIDTGRLRTKRFHDRVDLKILLGR